MTITQRGDVIPLPQAVFAGYALAKQEAQAYAYTHGGVKRFWEKGTDYRVLCADGSELRIRRIGYYDAAVFSGGEG